MNEGWSWVEETRAGVLVIRYLDKASGGNSLYRDGGSIGIIGAAQSLRTKPKDLAKGC
jgi:hypothetical protein